MQVNFTDFYGQHINVNDRTVSGNVRIKVSTMKSLNELPGKKPEECDIETDISLNEKQLRFFIETLKMMVSTEA